MASNGGQRSDATRGTTTREAVVGDGAAVGDFVGGGVFVEGTGGVGVGVQVRVAVGAGPWLPASCFVWMVQPKDAQYCTSALMWLAVKRTA